MRVLVAMSGGVDSSVAAAVVRDEGHDVVGATMKLWGGPSDSGCCSVADVEDARRVCQQIGIDHHVFNFSDDFEQMVVDPYVADHAAGRTPNPCIECNRHLKFDRFLDRAIRLGFDAVATGHHARRGTSPAGRPTLERGVDCDKDQSYVLHMLSAGQLARVLLPIGAMTKTEVRGRAVAMGLRTAHKPDSQDVCFITRDGGREKFLGSRIPLHPARVVDEDGRRMGEVPAVELVTVGQRRGMGPAVGGRYVLEVDVQACTVLMGPPERLLIGDVTVLSPSWVDGPPGAGERLHAQTSAHGRPLPGRWDGRDQVIFDEPVRVVAPGQSVVLYRGDTVVGGGIAAGRA